MSRSPSWPAFVTLAIAWLSSTVSCKDYEAEALRAIHSHGFSAVELGDYAWFGCGSGDDGYSHHFMARNPLGKPVRGYVCCGWGKGCTLRF